MSRGRKDVTMPSIGVPASGRRQFLQVLGAGALALGRLPAADKPGKPMRGLFPIGASPFTDANELDLECLAAQVKFLNRGGVHGVFWPQIASEWTTLSKKERLDGAEAMTVAGKGGKTAIVIGVQGPDTTASKLTFVSSSQITYQFNNGNDAGNWTVRVNNPGGQSSGAASFTVQAPTGIGSLTGLDARNTSIAAYAAQIRADGYSFIGQYIGRDSSYLTPAQASQL